MIPYSISFGELERAEGVAAEEVVRKAEESVLGDHPDICVRRTIVEGTPATVLVEASSGADLLVVGSRGRGGFASLTLGSVSQSCIHHAPCPVLVVRPCQPNLSGRPRSSDADREGR